MENSYASVAPAYFILVEIIVEDSHNETNIKKNKIMIFCKQQMSKSINPYCTQITLTRYAQQRHTSQRTTKGSCPLKSSGLHNNFDILSIPFQNSRSYHDVKKKSWSEWAPVFPREDTFPPYRYVTSDVNDWPLRSRLGGSGWSTVSLKSKTSVGGILNHNYPTEMRLKIEKNARSKWRIRRAREA